MINENKRVIDTTAVEGSVAGKRRINAKNQCHSNECHSDPAAPARFLLRSLHLHRLFHVQS